MNRWTLFLLLIIIGIIAAVIWLPLPNPQNNSNIELRAALDIGSGATNLKIAKVSKNTDKIITQVFETSIPVPYQKHLEQSSDNTFDKEVMDEGIKAIKSLKETANSYHVKKVVAVATAAFRQAANARQFAQEIEKQTGVQVRIIDQDEEGILAFRGALAITPIEPNQAVIWDIGGGSMQLTTLSASGSYLVEKGKTASIPFKNTIIEKVRKQDIQKVSSPNPLDLNQMQEALTYAHQAASAVDTYIKNKIKTPHNYVLAVGSLFNRGIKPLINNQSTLSQKELKAKVEGMAGKTDADLPGGSLAEVAVSNPLLVLGYMQTLDIDHLDIINVNNADGALTYPPYWEE